MHGTCSSIGYILLEQNRLHKNYKCGGSWIRHVSSIASSIVWSIVSSIVWTIVSSIVDYRLMDEVHNTAHNHTLYVFTSLEFRQIEYANNYENHTKTKNTKSESSAKRTFEKSNCRKCDKNKHCKFLKFKSSEPRKL